MPEETNNLAQQLLTAILLPEVTLHDLGQEDDAKLKEMVGKTKARQRKSVKHKEVNEDLLRMVVKL